MRSHGTSHANKTLAYDGGSVALLLITPSTASFWLLGRFPTPVVPVVSQWKDMVGTAFSLAIVGYVINLAMGRTLANKHGYDVDSNQVSPAVPGRLRGMGPQKPTNNSLGGW